MGNIFCALFPSDLTSSDPCHELGDGPRGRRITGIASGGFRIDTQLPPDEQIAWRGQGEKLLLILNEKKTGLIITVDEIHAADRREIAQLAANVQHFIREGLPIGLVFAGLPAAVSDLLNEGVATFLRRADRIDLHAVAIRDVKQSYQNRFHLSADAAEQAAVGTGGYPFLIQLVGYYLWREAEVNPGLDAASVDRAVLAARRRNSKVVIESALSTASPKDREYFQAMAEDVGPSTTGDIGKRIGARPNTTSNYRSRLIDAGLIASTGHGLVDFAIPGLREYLIDTSPRR